MRVRWRGLELPSKVVCEQETRRSDYGKFIAEPFERGFGHTIGNSIRRILLSSLEGSAVTRMKLKGAPHEFTSLRGVFEDVTAICLNVKSLVVKSYEDRPKVIRIEKNEIGPILAGDIITDSAVEIINKDHLIATLTDNVPFEMEMVVENGRGYVPATEQRHETVEFIPLDASFSPVTRVQYSVDETRVGQKTNYDRLAIQIWTDNSIDPEYALIEAAKILRKHLNPFIQFDKLDDPVFTKAKTINVVGIDPALEASLSKSLSDLDLSVRAMNALDAEGIKTVRDLVSRNEDSLLEIRNFGETTLNEVKEKLTKNGLRLGMRVPPTANPLPFDKIDSSGFSKPKKSTPVGIDSALEVDLSKPLSELDLSDRAMNVLSDEGIITIRDLVEQDENSLSEIKNFGESTLNEVKEKLAKIGLRLGMRIPSTQGPAQQPPSPL